MVALGFLLTGVLFSVLKFKVFGGSFGNQALFRFEVHSRVKRRPG